MEIGGIALVERLWWGDYKGFEAVGPSTDAFSLTVSITLPDHSGERNGLVYRLWLEASTGPQARRLKPPRAPNEDFLPRPGAAQAYVDAPHAHADLSGDLQ